MPASSMSRTEKFLTFLVIATIFFILAQFRTHLLSGQVPSYFDIVIMLFLLLFSWMLALMAEWVSRVEKINGGK